MSRGSLLSTKGFSASPSAPSSICESSAYVASQMLPIMGEGGRKKKTELQIYLWEEPNWLSLF